MEEREKYQTLAILSPDGTQYSHKVKCPFVPSYLRRKDNISDLQKLAFQWLSLSLFAQKQEKKIQGAAVEAGKSVCSSPEQLLTSWLH